MNKKEIIVKKDKKIVTLLQDFGFSFDDVNKILRNKDVKVNGKAIKDNLQVYSGDNVVFFFSDNMLNKKFKILYENDDVYVIYKNAGIESEGDKGVEKLLPNAVAVHRLDRNTEGLMVFAKNHKTEQKLVEAFKQKLVHKYYLAEVVGYLQTQEKVFKANLVKDSENSLVKIFQNKTKDSVEIETSIKTIKAGKESSLIQAELLTGRTHQIRAHLAFLNHPIIGDGKYGKNETNKKFGQKRQKLACFCLKFDFIGVDDLNFKEFKQYPLWYQK